MNIFRLTGDLSHLAAIIILLLKIWKTRSCAGISGKSQVLFALVFTTRYLDLLTSFISLYNTTMKIIYIGCAYATVYLIYLKFKATYDGNHDTFRVEFLVVPVGGLAFLVNHDFSPLEILWTFSIYLESVAILPQLFMISKTGEAETITTHYLFFLGLYRALYLINWVWRFYFEGFFDMIAIVAGVVQTILYCDFFYLYVTKDTGLPISVLRLLVPPVRLVAAAIWKTIEQRVVAQYGLIEEFISLVTDIVPEILTIDQRVQLTLGLRARLILELCQSTADLETVQPHLDRMQLLIKVGATNIETPHLEFVELVKKMLNNSDHRQQFFQKDFPEDFGPTYDKALLILIWTFLSRLEKLLTLKTFQEVSSMFQVASSVLEECVQSQSQEQLKLLLHYQKGHSHLDHNGKPLYIQ
ncbi:ER lumen protein-retaining receptor 2 ERD2-like protein 1 [Takifugu flavidus]|uniref:ER lumen protein-retaining receptor n=1 Tax=Takifugu flavidus TaxID=433684 RepID=A0A5C6PQ66_9TELE|nr:ER lumen protein-retaining receptor 2 ERD2-like protein 1 [Takifugu flavidus]